MATPAPTTDAAVIVSHPPFAVLRLANPVLDRLLRSPVGGGLRKQYLTLAFTGRKSGRSFEFPIRIHQADGILYAVTSNRWRLNFRGGAPVRITLDGRSADYHGELIEDCDEVAELLVRLTEGYGPKRAQHKLALKFRTPGTPSQDDFSAVSRRERIAAIRFTAV